VSTKKKSGHWEFQGEKRENAKTAEEVKNSTRERKREGGGDDVEALKGKEG